MRRICGIITVVAGMVLAGCASMIVSATADVQVHYHAIVHQQVDVHEADREYGYHQIEHSDRMVEYEQGTLVIVMIDGRTNTLIWRGWS